MTISRVRQYLQQTLRIANGGDVFSQDCLVVTGGAEAPSNDVEIHRADFG